MAHSVAVKRALVSVSDKTDLIPFCRRLVRHGVQLISTGGTAGALREANLPVTGVDQVTGYPEMMEGRVKTLHPSIHGGLLALRDREDHLTAMRDHNIEPIDLVCVNLYPFEQTVQDPNVADKDAIEQIDIGGPSMIRSAAKNHAFVATVTSPSQYDRVCNDIDANQGTTTLELRRWLASAAFARTAAYDTAIASWMSRRDPNRSTAADDFPDSMILRFHRGEPLRYGENPHQSGAVYLDPATAEPSVARARQLHGKALSYCNLYDANGALELVKEVDPRRAAAAAVIKHANPCGFAIADRTADAIERAYDGDRLAAFGGIIACNRVIDGPTADRIVAGDGFLEVIVAPGYEPTALETLKQRWKNTRLLEIDPLGPPKSRDPRELDFKHITGGMLVQQRDLVVIEPHSWEHVAGPAPDDDLLADASVAVLAVRHLKSNAIALAKTRMLVGAGAGQMDRLASCRIAVDKAENRADGSVAASDAFFPFRDGPDHLIKAGVRAIVQPGGSRRDQETIDACGAARVTLLLTGRRHFRH